MAARQWKTNPARQAADATCEPARNRRSVRPAPEAEQAIANPPTRRGAAERTGSRSARRVRTAGWALLRSRGGIRPWADRSGRDRRRPPYFVIFLQAGTQFDGFHANDAIQARVVRRVAAEDLDPQQCFFKLITCEGLFYDEAQEPAGAFRSGKGVTGEDLVQLRADSFGRRLCRAAGAGGNGSVRFPGGGGHSLNLMIRGRESFGSFYWEAASSKKKPE